MCLNFGHLDAIAVKTLDGGNVEVEPSANLGVLTSLSRKNKHLTPTGRIEDRL